jgi:pilus assembly protein CpaE
MDSGTFRLLIITENAETTRTLKIRAENTRLPGLSIDALPVESTLEQVGLKYTISFEPDAILIDLSQPKLLFEIVGLLHGKLPDAWLLAASEHTDPELIISIVRAGAREFLTKPISSEALGDALKRCRDEISKTKPTAMMGKLYGIAPAKEGIGATSLTVNLASATSRLDSSSSVALVDMNTPVGYAATYLDLHSEYDIGDALQSSLRLDTVLLKSFMTRKRELSVLPGLREIGGDFKIEPDAVNRLLRVAGETYSHVFVDLRHHPEDEIFDLTLSHCDSMILVVTPELPVLWRADRIMRSLQEKAGVEKIQIVVNRFRKNSEITEKEIEKVLKKKIYWSLPNDYRASTNSINTGEPVVSLNHSALAVNYVGFTRKLTGIKDTRRKDGFLKWFS